MSRGHVEGSPSGRGGGRRRAVCREVNEQIAGRQPSGMFVEFACECANHECADAIVLSIVEYEDVRRHPSRFAVAPGHEVPAREQLVEVTARYAVVERY